MLELYGISDLRFQIYDRCIVKQFKNKTGVLDENLLFRLHCWRQKVP